MKPSEVAIALKHVIDTRLTAFLWGPAGAGKSEVVRQVAANAGLEFRDVRLNLLDPTDLKGFPVPDVKSKAMRWLPAEFLPRDPKSKGVLFLDELNLAPNAVQAAAYQLTLDRRIGEYELPAGWAVIAAGNRDSDKAFVTRMAGPLANRLIHIDFDVDLDDFVDYQMNRGMEPEQIAFHRFKSTLLHSFDAKSNPRSFPTPRTWEFVDRIRKGNMPQNIEFELIKGAVGEGAAAEFSAFIRTIKDLPTLDQIRLDPTDTPVPKNPSQLYALTTTLAMDTKPSSFKRYMLYVERMPVEFQVVYVKDCLRRDNSLRHDKTFQSWGMKNKDVVL